jgi:hypothetical protein
MKLIDVTFKEIADSYLEDEKIRIRVHYKILIYELKSFAQMAERLDILINKQTFGQITQPEIKEMKYLEEEINEYMRKKKGWDYED